jgi:UDP-N-acetylmuramoylalanine--D-glutamate ligase
VELEGIQAVVVGMARSGVAAARLLVRRGAHVVATDRKTEAELPPAVAQLAGDGVRLELGGHVRETFARAKLVVVSPGVPWETPELQVAREAGAEVIGELELGARLIPGPLAAVTGTKGKSTTTAALGAMLEASGLDTRVGGNIGEAVTGIVDGATSGTSFVLEVSSFQLESSETLHPKVAVFLNLSPDHLDRHPSFEAYGEAKARIFRNQTASDFAVVNADDPEVRRLTADLRARVVPFSAQDAAGAADRAFWSGDDAVLRLGGRETLLFHRQDVKVPGAHLALDMLVAAAAATLMGGSPEGIRRAISSFTGVEHVLEKVAEIDGVAYYNDSKATNVAAARMSLAAFTGPVLLVLGGKYKGGDFRELAPLLVEHGSTVLAIGEARGMIAEALSGAVRVVSCATLRDAVREGHRLARPGDVVLLAPACASFDMFLDYAERGRAFKAEVRALQPGAGPA